MRTVALLVTLTIFAASLQAKESPPRDALAGIDAVIEQALQTFQVPGLSVAVVVGDEVVLSKGYGFRDVEKKLPMTPETLMPIASVTKQFTVGALGTLVRQGKLEWDKPVREYLPAFRLHNEYATSHVTPRDLVTHRTGLPRHDLAWYGSDRSREQLFGVLQHFPFSRDIRTRFQYNNLMYMTSGYLAGQLAKSSWEELVKSALFNPPRDEALQLHRRGHACRPESFAGLRAERAAPAGAHSTRAGRYDGADGLDQFIGRRDGAACADDAGGRDV